jgi:hypothetical protein
MSHERNVSCSKTTELYLCILLCKDSFSGETNICLNNNENGRYLISGISLIMFAQSQKIEKPNNLKVLGREQEIKRI